MNPLVLLIASLLSLLPTLIGPILFPFIKLSFFAPLVVLLLYKLPRVKLFSSTLIIGFILDLLSSHTPFGFWIINYWTTLWLLLFLKPLFFEDKFLTLPILTCFFSQISTLLYVLSMNLFFLKMPVHFYWVVTDLLLYPFFDALYALLIFNLPLYYLNKKLPQKRRLSKSFRLSEES